MNTISTVVFAVVGITVIMIFTTAINDYHGCCRDYQYHHQCGNQYRHKMNSIGVFGLRV